jgi:actin-like ATPase involved in cell morphogenesis
MSYRLGVDLGTTYTAAAVSTEGATPVMVGLGNRAMQVPSVLFLDRDDTFLAGEAAERRGLQEPDRVVREFKRRIGDQVPILVAGSPQSPQSLQAKLLSWVVALVTQRQGEAPEHVTVTHPANWAQFKQDLMTQALAMADLSRTDLCTEPTAVAVWYASRNVLSEGDCIAVYDLGGGTFDAAVLRKTSDGFELLGSPEGLAQLGGIDFDEAVFRHVIRSLHDRLDRLSPSEELSAGLARLRRDCVDAKEALSSEISVELQIALPGLTTSVRVTRNEFETMIRPAVDDSIAALRRALRSAAINDGDLHSIVLTGGSSRVPLVTELLGSAFDRPLALDTHPKHDVALGATLVPRSDNRSSVRRRPEAARQGVSATAARDHREPRTSDPAAAPTPVRPRNAAVRGDRGDSVLDELTLVTAEIDEHLALIEKQAAATGRKELARRISIERRRQQSREPAMVVFAGEPSQGKSRLINSLIDRPGLLPVDGDVSTGVHVVMRYADEDSAAVHLTASEEPLEVEVGAIADYVSVAENPANHKGVRYVSLELASDLLAKGVQLVDTPGVGGLDAAHGRYTLAALGQADAFVFVIDAGGPISQPELDFLANAATRIEVVVLVLTKIDNHPEWRTILAENRELIAHHAPALSGAPVIPLSAKMATMAESVEGPLRDRIRAQSNMDALQAWLANTVAARRRRVRLRNAIRLACSAADQLDALYQHAAISLGSSGDAAVELRQRKTHLEELRRTSSTWRPRLASELTRVERRLRTEIATGCATIRKRVESTISSEWTDALRERLPSDLELELSALKVEIQNALAAGLQSVTATVAGSLGIAEVEMPAVEFVGVGAVAGEVQRAAAVKGRDGARAFTSVAMSGTSLLYGNPFAFLRILVALSGVGFDLGSSRRARDQQEARSFLEETLANWKSEATLVLTDTIADGRTAIEELVNAAVSDRLATATADIAELSQRAASDERRTRQKRQIENLRGSLAQARKSLELLLDSPELEVAS